MSHPSIFIVEITALISVDISIYFYFYFSSFSTWSFSCLAMIVGALLLLVTAVAVYDSNPCHML